MLDLPVTMVHTSRRCRTKPSFDLEGYGSTGFLVLVCVNLLQSFAVVGLPSPQSKVNAASVSEEVLTAGSNFTLDCEGNRPIHWEILSSQGGLSDTRTTQEGNAEHGYSAKLHLRSIDVRDVGSYTCRFNSSDKLETNILKFVYIYVKDPTKPLAPTDSLIRGIQFEKLTIPCKPSAPDVQVTLLVDDVPIIPGEPLAELEDRIVTYDPQIGFTIPDIQMHDSPHVFSCRGVLKGVEDTRIFNTSIMNHMDSMPKPQISYSLSCDSTTVIQCVVRIAKDVDISVRWVYPNNDNIYPARAKNNPYIKDTDDNFRVAKYTLFILNTKNEDMGLYKCEIVDLNGNINSDEILLSEDCKIVADQMFWHVIVLLLPIPILLLFHVSLYFSMSYLCFFKSLHQLYLMRAIDMGIQKPLGELTNPKSRQYSITYHWSS